MPQGKAWFIKQGVKKESYLIQALEQDNGLRRNSRIYKQLKQELTDVQNVIRNMSSDLPPVLNGKVLTQMNPFNSSNQFSDNSTTALSRTPLPSTSDTIEEPTGITKQERVMNLRKITSSVEYSKREIPSQEKLGDVVEPEFKQ